MTVWATRADQVDLRGPNPHDLARSRKVGLLFVRDGTDVALHRRLVTLLPLVEEDRNGDSSQDADDDDDDEELDEGEALVLVPHCLVHTSDHVSPLPGSAKRRPPAEARSTGVTSTLECGIFSFLLLRPEQVGSRPSRGHAIDACGAVS